MPHLLQPGLHVLVLEVQSVDAGFGDLDLVEVLVHGGRLRFAEADEVDDVGEDLDEAIVGGAEEVGEGEVGDAALDEEFPQRGVEAHEVPRVAGDDVHVLLADFFRGRAHCGLHRLARRVHEEFGEPLEDLLDLLGLWLHEVVAGEWDADIVDTSCDFLVCLYRS